ncbi:MAG: hypothetical protein AB1489_28585 [Acidobacteriota bacterium]
MKTDIMIAWTSFAGTLLLVVIGFLNFTIFLRQLRAAREQIQMAIKQLEIARKQPEIQLIQRAITETTDHLRILVEKPYLRPYFYDNKTWEIGDQASNDEVKAMAELLLHNFASALMHAASFPQYPSPGVDRVIMFHLRHSPTLRVLLIEIFDRFPLTGLTMLCLKNSTRSEVEADLNQLISINELDEPERKRRKDLLQLFQNRESNDALMFTKYNMGILTNDINGKLTK